MYTAQVGRYSWIAILEPVHCIHCASNTSMRHSSLLDFFHMTSLNGWNFFPYRNFKPFDCIIWSVAILTSMTFCGLFITQQIQGIIISIDDTKIWNLKIWRIFFSFSDLYFKTIEYLILKWRISNCKKYHFRISWGHCTLLMFIGIL